jgi:hypothetical protein
MIYSYIIPSQGRINLGAKGAFAPGRQIKRGGINKIASKKGFMIVINTRKMFDLSILYIESDLVEKIK